MRLNHDDRRVLEQLKKLTGIANASDVVRWALREALASRTRDGSK